MAHTSRAPLVFGNHTAPAVVRLGQPAVADVDFYVASRTATDEKVEGADLANSTLATTEPSRTVTLSVTQGGTADDTISEFIIVGKDEKGRRQRVVLGDSDWDSGTDAETVVAFRSVESVEITGHSVGGGTADTYTVGFGNGLGIGVKLGAKKDVILGLLDRAVDPVVDSEINVDADDENGNTVDLSGSTYDGTKEAVVVVNP